MKGRIGNKQYRQNSKPKNSRSTNSSNTNSKDGVIREIHNVKCVYLNARSVVNKQKELELLIMEEDLDIIGITETCLNRKS